MPTDDELPLLARRLNQLFETVVNPETGRKWTNAEVARSIASTVTADKQVAASTISQMRLGVKSNPTASTLTLLARFFWVTLDYFVEEDEVEAERARVTSELLRVAEDSDVRNIAFRSSGLSVESLRMVTTVIEQARRLEGLDD
ncbi:XRE family transcriptional regulator [Streptomyces sp. AJS327]|uniref:helix-turn-helix domain-containing protein n=1 Tax=Streptomyces sp. AJS327 TaxID=2545265 RepID=UPI0015DEE098|nr:helix-turn-helix domain-containing protein [Streptomyces sp. AJS327]MBA0053669.1 XRE family transcriptional regulator [Streptomyces sp. AJS327]